MVELNGDTGAVLMQAFGQTEQAGNILVVINTQLGGAVSGKGKIDADIFNGDQRGAAFCSQRIIIQLLFTDFSI